MHDLRVALRRCLSIAEICMALDPLEDWKEMRKSGRELFKQLGQLRDTQVMKEWIGCLAGLQNPAGMKLAAHLGEREQQECEKAAIILACFDLRKWGRWQSRLALTAMSAVPLEDPIFQQFALERWQAARELHRQALRNRSHIAYHRLRIGLKRFRYTVENFLPHRHEIWGKDLKLLQDALGELHDLHVLWRTALAIGALTDPGIRSNLRDEIDKESSDRIQRYRAQTVGKPSVWTLWREGLPSGPELEQAAEARIRIWASFRDPSPASTRNTADAALKLFDGLERAGIKATENSVPEQAILRLAAIMRNVAPSSAKGKKRGKKSYKKIIRAEPPLGLSAEVYELAALAARFRLGAVRHPESRQLMRLTDEQKGAVQLAAAILCLADAFTSGGTRSIDRLCVSRVSDAILISAAGFSTGDPLARKLAAARYPLEVVCGAPVLIRPLQG